MPLPDDLVERSWAHPHSQRGGRRFGVTRRLAEEITHAANASPDPTPSTPAMPARPDVAATAARTFPPITAVA